ncbi:MAG: hypothetical protein WCS52_04670 [bacterium]
MDCDDKLNEMREGLLEFAESGPSRAKHGLITALFPFIYQAARRISTRAISRWLEETHQTKISPAGVSKSLREPERHWEGYWELIEPSARIFEAHNPAAMESFLFDRELFEKMAAENQNLEGDNQDDYWNAIEALQKEWFALDDKTLSNMWKYVPKVVHDDDNLKEKTP